MFDRVWFTCPCGEMLEAQSKAGPQTLNDYTPFTAPPAVAVDVIGEELFCAKCQETYVVRGQVTTSLQLEKGAARRPLNYASLSAEEQWAIDKALGILDDKA
jgi:hypothetical protein